MARTKKQPFQNNQVREHDVAAFDEWQIYVDLFADTTDDDDAPLLVPLFPCEGVVPGNVGMMTARAARALAGVGTPEDVVSARDFMLKRRAKTCH